MVFSTFLINSADMAKSRVKRASEGQLYWDCKHGFDCKPDIRDKYEHRTPADKILQWGSSAVYLGGLGIGSGGATLRPPATAVEPIGDLIPLETLGPREPTAVDSTVSVTEPAAPRPPAVGGSGRGDTFQRPSTNSVSVGDATADTPSVITPETVVDPEPVDAGIVTDTADSGSVTVLPSSDPNDPAVLEVPAETASRTRTVTARTGGRGANKITAMTHLHPTILGETSEEAQVLVGGTGIGDSMSENIELALFGEPQSSTPETLNTIRRRGLSNPFSRRYYRQVTVTDTDFVTKPREFLYKQGFDNPAYEPETFEDSIPLGSANEAERPSPEYLDLGRLGRVQYTQSPGRTLGVSRIGTKFSIQTRSGATVGAQVHYRYPISPVLEEIELQPLLGNESTFERSAASISESSFTEATPSASAATRGLNEGFELIELPTEEELVDNISDSALEDHYEDVPLGHLSFGSYAYTRTVSYSDFSNTNEVISTIADVVNSIGKTADNTENRRKRPWTPVTPVTPGSDTSDNVVDGDDVWRSYYLRPELYPKFKVRRLEAFA